MHKKKKEDPVEIKDKENSPISQEKFNFIETPISTSQFTHAKFDFEEPALQFSSYINHFKPKDDFRYETKNIVYRD